MFDGYQLGICWQDQETIADTTQTHQHRRQRDRIMPIKDPIFATRVGFFMANLLSRRSLENQTDYSESKPEVLWCLLLEWFISEIWAALNPHLHSRVFKILLNVKMVSLLNISMDNSTQLYIIVLIWELIQTQIYMQNKYAANLSFK
jgi:hypothetical protein